MVLTLHDLLFLFFTYSTLDRDPHQLQYVHQGDLKQNVFRTLFLAPSFLWPEPPVCRSVTVSSQCIQTYWFATGLVHRGFELLLWLKWGRVVLNCTQWQDIVKMTGDMMGCSGWLWCTLYPTTPYVYHNTPLVIAFQPVDRLRWFFHAVRLIQTRPYMLYLWVTSTYLAACLQGMAGTRDSGNLQLPSMIRDSLCYTTTSETEYIHRDNKINLKPMETETDANIIHMTQGVSLKKHTPCSLASRKCDLYLPERYWFYRINNCCLIKELRFLKNVCTIQIINKMWNSVLAKKKKKINKTVW